MRNLVGSLYLRWRSFWKNRFRISSNAAHSFDYISDVYGANRVGKHTRFTELEETAKQLIYQYVKSRISNRDFAKKFCEVANKFNKRINTGDEYVIDEDTPLWLNTFIGYHFAQWLNYLRIELYIEDHPQEIQEELAEVYAKMKDRNYNEEFMSTCIKLLDNLSYKPKN